ncbi:MAG: hypothetical protein ACK5RO_13735 [Pseudobdellovibrionaceae bacterium]|jgi:hypothetical protein
MKKQNKWILTSALGFELTGIIVGSVFLGRFIESFYPSKGLIIALLLVAGFVSWIIHTIYLLKRIEKE